MNMQFIHVSTKSFSVRHITGIDYSNLFSWSISGCKQCFVIVWGQSKHHRLLIPWKIQRTEELVLLFTKQMKKAIVDDPH